MAECALPMIVSETWAVILDGIAGGPLDITEKATQTLAYFLRPPPAKALGAGGLPCEVLQLVRGNTVAHMIETLDT